MRKHLPLLTLLILSSFVLAPRVFAQSLVPMPDQEGATEPTVQEEILDVPAEQQPIVGNLSEITDAASTSTMTISAIPPRLGDDGSLAGDPGEVIQSQVRVRNNGSQRVVIETTMEDFIIGEDGETPLPVEGADSNWSLADWLSIPRTHHTLEPFETVDIPVVISVPDDARPGGRYAMIMHYPTQIGNLGQEVQVLGGGAAVNQRVGTLVYFRVNGDVTESANIRNLMVPNLLEYGPVPISFDIENLSDIHIQPRLDVEIHNMLGQKIEEIEIDSRNIFPGSLRNFTTNWDRVWGLGRYQVKVVAAYGETGKVTMAAQYFWIIPYTLILGIVFALLALVGIGIAIRRHMAHRNSIEQQHITLLEDRIRQLETELKDR